MGQETSTLRSLQILQVKKNTPSYHCGLIPFMHFIVGVDNLPVSSSKDVSRLLNLWQKNGKVVLSILDTRNNSVKDYTLKSDTIVPTNTASVIQSPIQKPLSVPIGLSVKLHEGQPSTLSMKVLNIQDNSPIHNKLDVNDYIVGVLNQYLFEMDDFQNFLYRNVNKQVTLCVFNEIMRTIRFVNIVPQNECLLGCEYGTGILYQVPPVDVSIDFECDGLYSYSNVNNNIVNDQQQATNNVPPDVSLPNVNELEVSQNKETANLKSNVNALNADAYINNTEKEHVLKNVFHAQKHLSVENNKQNNEDGNKLQMDYVPESNKNINTSNNQNICINPEETARTLPLTDKEIKNISNVRIKLNEKIYTEKPNILSADIFISPDVESINSSHKQFNTVNKKTQNTYSSETINQYLDSKTEISELYSKSTTEECNISSSATDNNENLLNNIQNVTSLITETIKGVNLNIAPNVNEDSNSNKDNINAASNNKNLESSIEKDVSLSNLIDNMSIAPHQELYYNGINLENINNQTNASFLPPSSNKQNQISNFNQVNQLSSTSLLDNNSNLPDQSTIRSSENILDAVNSTDKSSKSIDSKSNVTQSDNNSIQEIKDNTIKNKNIIIDDTDNRSIQENLNEKTLDNKSNQENLNDKILDYKSIQENLNDKILDNKSNQENL
ncbi:hypothetical protein EDEG_02029, partial [Edhazardia aedis USNM 41457]